MIFKLELELGVFFVGLQGEDVVCVAALQNLEDGGEVDTECDWFVAFVRVEALSAEVHGDECDMRGVHGLERKTTLVAVDVGFLNHITQGVKNLSEENGRLEFRLHFEMVDLCPPKLALIVLLLKCGGNLAVGGKHGK